MGSCTSKNALYEYKRESGLLVKSDMCKIKNVTLKYIFNDGYYCLQIKVDNYKFIPDVFIFNQWQMEPTFSYKICFHNYLPNDINKIIFDYNGQIVNYKVPLCLGGEYDYICEFNYNGQINNTTFSKSN